MPKLVQNRSESLCTGLWAPCRICSTRFGPALGPNPVRNRRFPTGSLKVFGALFAQPSRGREGDRNRKNGVTLSVPCRWGTKQNKGLLLGLCRNRRKDYGFGRHTVRCTHLRPFQQVSGFGQARGGTYMEPTGLAK